MFAKYFGRVPERPNGTDCKSVVSDFGGSNPPLPTKSLVVTKKVALTIFIYHKKLVDSN